VECPKCHFDKAQYIEMQTRSADEPMTIFYTCVNCNNTWTD
jgi:DNA-directed RNA polymerase subunit M/transcription elongation factor TFIIS